MSIREACPCDKSKRIHVPLWLQVNKFPDEEFRIFEWDLWPRVWLCTLHPLLSSESIYSLPLWSLVDAWLDIKCPFPPTVSFLRSLPLFSVGRQDQLKLHLIRESTLYNSQFDSGESWTDGKPFRFSQWPTSLSRIPVGENLRSGEGFQAANGHPKGLKWSKGGSIWLHHSNGTWNWVAELRYTILDHCHVIDSIRPKWSRQIRFKQDSPYSFVERTVSTSGHTISLRTVWVG